MRKEFEKAGEHLLRALPTADHSCHASVALFYCVQAVSLHRCAVTPVLAVHDIKEESSVCFFPTAVLDWLFVLLIMLTVSAVVDSSDGNGMAMPHVFPFSRDKPIFPFKSHRSKLIPQHFSSR